MNSTTSRRKKRYVNAYVQGRILGRIAGYWILYHIVLWHGLFVYRYAQVRMSAADGETSGGVQSVYWQFCIDYSPLLVCSLLIMPLFMLDFLRLTHRFVGPLVRVRDSLIKLMDNERVATVEFRKGDLLPEIQTTFCDFLAFYDKQQHCGASAQADSGFTVVASRDSRSDAPSSVVRDERAPEPVEAAV